MEQQTKNCPYCGGEIMAAAKKCKHCGKWLDGREEKKETTAPQEIPVAKEEPVVKEKPASKEPETKNCPYCGEEIMAAAKKCKHCGEWVTPREEIEKTTATTKPSEKANKLPKGPVDENIPKYADFFFLLAIIGTIIVAIHDAGVTHGAGKKLNGLVQIANWIPEQVGNLMDGIGFIGLLVLLMNLTKKFGKQMDVLCGSAIALYGIATICGVIDSDVMALIALPAYFLCPPAVFMLGLKLKGEYHNPLMSLGKGMMIWAVAFFIILAIGMAQAYEEGSLASGAIWAGAVITAGFYYVFKSCLADASTKPQENENWSLSVLCVAVVVGFILMVCL